MNLNKQPLVFFFRKFLYSLSPEARACSLAHIAHSICPIAPKQTHCRQHDKRT